MNYKTKSTHIDSSQGIVLISLKHLDISTFCFSIHRGSDKLADVESGLDKVRVFG
jgi:hypothetical protein